MNEEEFLQFRGQMGKATAGQSLTNDPENPAPFERPPRFTVVHEATKYLWSEITAPEMYIPVMETLAQGTPVMDVVQTILMGEFQRGAWNPDLMAMLAEPLIYMFIALAERLDIDVVIYNGEVEDEEDEEPLGNTFSSAKIEELKKAYQAGKIPQGTIPAEMQQTIEALPEIPSLMSRPSVEPERMPTTTEPSLMAPPQGL